MAEIENIDINKIEEVNEDFTITVKNKSDILNELNFKSEEDKLLCESIIDSLENSVYDNVRDGLTVSIPYIGNLRRNKVYESIAQSKKNFKAVRSFVSKEEYKQYVVEVIVDAKTKQLELDKRKVLITHLRRVNKKKYERYYMDFGRAYAELYLTAILWLREIPFDRDVQDAYDRLKENYE